jgi:outer membrane receptor for ferrienterochelin and colicins
VRHISLNNYLTVTKYILKNLILFFCILINTISFEKHKGTVTADGMPLQMANIVLKNEKSTITTANGSYHFDGVPMGTMKLPLPIPVLNPKLNVIITDTTTMS